jgi:UDP-glucose 4-epimerase
MVFIGYFVICVSIVFRRCCDQRPCVNSWSGSAVERLQSSAAVALYLVWQQSRADPLHKDDPSRLAADAAKARKLFADRPAYPDLVSIIRTDWEWRTKMHHD